MPVPPKHKVKRHEWNSSMAHGLGCLAAIEVIQYRHADNAFDKQRCAGDDWRTRGVPRTPRERGEPASHKENHL